MKSHSVWPFWFVISIFGGFSFWFLNEAISTEQVYDGVISSLSSQQSYVEKVDVGGTNFVIPSWDYFKEQSIWSLVSSKKALSDNFVPNDLVDVGVAHGDKGQAYQVSAKIQPNLNAMFDAAKLDGVDLMLSSAYRSKEDQAELFDFYSTERGQAYTTSHVAQPGRSEHQTGLSVDISTSSEQCLQDSSNCSLDWVTINWLGENANRFGFIQRYPSGKQSITGIVNEEWHYRYVGVSLANILYSSGMTLDEFVTEIAPGYAK